jgi:hypothetical protein
MSGCIEKTETSQTGMANVQLAEDSPTQLQVDFDADVSSNLFRVRGSLMFAGNSSYPYLLLNATLRQGNKAIQSTKFLFIQTRPSDDLSFEISKNMKIPCGRYNCTLEVVGPGGLLDCETKNVALPSLGRRPRIQQVPLHQRSWRQRPLSNCIKNLCHSKRMRKVEK